MQHTYVKCHLNLFLPLFCSDRPRRESETQLFDIELYGNIHIVDLKGYVIVFLHPSAPLVMMFAVEWHRKHSYCHRTAWLSCRTIYTKTDRVQETLNFPTKLQLKHGGSVNCSQLLYAAFLNLSLVCFYHIFNIFFISNLH